MKKYLLKSLLIIALIMLQTNMHAIILQCHVEIPGTLSSLLGTEASEITDLTLTGDLNGDDIYTIKRMPNLSILDIKKANILNGGKTYSNVEKTFGKRHYPDNTMGDYIFSGCKALTSITIPNSVTSIGQNAFEKCQKLTSITIGNSVISINEFAFRGCTGLKEIIVSEQNQSYSTIDGVLFNKDSTSLLVYPLGKPENSYIIPNRVTSIRKYAFDGCIRLKEFIVSEQNSNYSTIDGVLFDKNKTSLIKFPIRKQESVYIIPSSVTEIGERAFSGCKRLKSVTIPNSVISIGEEAFGGCTGLTNVIIPNYITTIGDYTFIACKALTCITIPYYVNSIGEYAFFGCKNLREIHIKNPEPPRVSTIIYKNSFNVNRATCKLYVPNNSYTAYRNAKEWGSFRNIIEEKDKETIDPNIAFRRLYHRFKPF